jgi:hypothetical protein
VPAEVPERLKGRFPIYFAGDLVYYEVELENTGAEPLRDLRVIARQESFEESGLRGEPLGYRPMPVEIARLDPGERMVLPRHFRAPEILRRPRPVNFDQTHVTVRSGSGEDAETLLDAPHAGIVDPPAL